MNKRLLSYIFCCAFLLFLFAAVIRERKERKTSPDLSHAEKMTIQETGDMDVSSADEVKNDGTSPLPPSVGEIPENTRSRVELGEEYVYNGIGCTINSVIVTDSDESFPDRYPEYAEKEKWNNGCITTGDTAKLYVGAGQGDVHFNKMVSFKVIMDITFRNYKSYDDYALFYQTNYSLYGIFIQQETEMGEFSFTCDYNSEYGDPDDLKSVHHVIVPAGSEYQAVFIFDAAAVKKDDEDQESAGYTYPFDGSGDIYLVPSSFISRWYEGNRDIPYYYIKDEDIQKDIHRNFTDEDFKIRRMTYQEYLDEKDQEK